MLIGLSPNALDGARPLGPTFQPTFSPHASTATKKAGWNTTRPKPFDALASADRRRVLKPALGPQRIHPAGDLQRRALSDVLLEHLAVVPDVLDDPVGPVL